MINSTGLSVNSEYSDKDLVIYSECDSDSNKNKIKNKQKGVKSSPGNSSYNKIIK